jgi:hypothetical protein
MTVPRADAPAGEPDPGHAGLSAQPIPTQSMPAQSMQVQATPVPSVPHQPAPPAAAGHSGPAANPRDELAGTLSRLTSDDLDPAERRRLLARLAGELRTLGVRDMFKPKAAVRWVGDVLGDIAPRITIRDRDTLRRHFPGLTDEALAERLIRNAGRTTAAVGAAGGGIAAVEWVATPTLLTAPVLLAAETAAVVAIELKLIGELHELYGAPITGGPAQRGVALVQSWAHRRGVNPLLPGIGAAAVLGTATRKELRDRLLRRFGRNLSTLGPFLTGAAVGGYLNRRATIALGHHIRKDLASRYRRPALPRWPGQSRPG